MLLYDVGLSYSRPFSDFNFLKLADEFYIWTRSRQNFSWIWKSIVKKLKAQSSGYSDWESHFFFGSREILWKTLSWPVLTRPVLSLRNHIVDTAGHVSKFENSKCIGPIWIWPDYIKIITNHNKIWSEKSFLTLSRHLDNVLGRTNSTSSVFVTTTENLVFPKVFLYTVWQTHH